MSSPPWKEFEDLVERLQRSFHPGAVVTRNDHVRGRNSQSLRQIDISIRQKVGIHDILIIIDCKKRSRKIDIGGVSEFAGLQNS